MVRLRYAVVAIVGLLAYVTAYGSSPYRGQKSVGVYAGYVTRNESAAAGIYFQYRFARCFRIAPSAGYIFRHRGEDAFAIDLDFHAPFAVGGGDRVNIYPVAGIGYSGIGIKGEGADPRAAVDTRHRVDRIGINLGAGIECFASPTLRLALEGKWRGRSDYPTGIFTMSIGYRF